MADNSIPSWALPLFEDVATIKQMMVSHLETHKTEHNGEMRRLLLFGVGIGTGLAGAGTGLLKLLVI